MRLKTASLLFATALLAARSASAWESPESVEGTTLIDVEQAHALHAKGVPFVDVRNARQYARAHIPGAVNLDLKNGLSEETLARVAGKDQPLVIYCNGMNCSRSYRASTEAVEWGFTKIHYFRQGVAGWRDSGLPVESSFPDE